MRCRTLKVQVDYVRFGGVQRWFPLWKMTLFLSFHISLSTAQNPISAGSGGWNTSISRSCSWRFFNCWKTSTYPSMCFLHQITISPFYLPFKCTNYYFLVTSLSKKSCSFINGNQKAKRGSEIYRNTTLVCTIDLSLQAGQFLVDIYAIFQFLFK